MNKQSRESYLQILIKLAGPNEKKRADSLNWNHIKKDIDPSNPEKQYSKDEIDQLLKNSQNLIIPQEQIAKIESLNLEPKFQSRIDKNSKSFLIIGTVVTSSSDNEINEKMGLINWFVEFAEVEKNGLGVSPEFTTLEQLKTNFNKFMEDVRRKKNEVDGARQTSKEIDYKTNEVVYQFSDGWRVVYLPAVGEMEEYPGLPGTSHDRILEGNKNGLCLGSSNKLYQDNSSGRVYSIRDPKNKPKATIRILNNRLDECKAKNNLTPDIETCLHLVEWFNSIEGLGYKNSQDYKMFPPLTIEAAKEKFSRKPESAYTNGWAGHWFGKGIPELDEDVKEKIRNNDILIIKSGMGKNPKYTEMVRPVVRYWCKQYLDGNAEYDILFGSWGDPPTHESYKTYKKDPIMQQAAVKLSQENVSWFIMLDLPSVKEYRPLLTSKMIENFIEKNSWDFLSDYIDKDWVTEENKIFAFKKLTEKDPYEFLRKYSEDHRIPKDIVNDLIIKAVNKLAEKDPYEFLREYSEDHRIPKDIVNDLIIKAVNELAEEEPYDFLTSHSYNSRIPDHIRQDLIIKAAINLVEQEPYRFLEYYSRDQRIPDQIRQDLFIKAAINLVEEAPLIFLEYYSRDQRIPEHIRSELIIKAAINMAEEDPNVFLEEYSKDHRIPDPIRQELIIKAVTKVAEQNPDYYEASYLSSRVKEIVKNVLSKQASHQIPMTKYSRLIHLSQILQSAGFHKEANQVLLLINI